MPKAIVNVGTIGHVDHGKQTLVMALAIAVLSTAATVHSEGACTNRLRAFDAKVIDNPYKKSKGDKRRDRAERRRKWGI